MPRKGSMTRAAEEHAATRKQGWLDGILNSPTARQILADVLVAAASAAAAALVKGLEEQRSQGRAAQSAGAAAKGGAPAVQLIDTAAEAMSGMVSDAAKKLLPRALAGGGEGQKRARGTQQGGSEDERDEIGGASKSGSERKRGRKALERNVSG